MSGYFHQSGTLVLGSSLPAALTAALLARRGYDVLWPGPVPPATAKLGDGPVQVGPALCPAPERTPALLHALSEIGLDKELRRLARPVPLQLLDERLRLTLPGEAARAPGAAEAFAALNPPRRDTDPLGKKKEEPEPVSLGFFGRRARARWEEARRAALPAPGGVVGELADALELLLGDGLNARRSAMDVIAAPHALPGGAPHLVELVHRRFLEMGGRTVNGALARRLESFQAGWGGAKCRLGSGDELSGRVLVVGLDDAERARLLELPATRAGRRLSARLRGSAAECADDLVRLSLVVRTKGLPVPLGPAAIVRAPTPLLLERRPMGGGQEEISVFWRRGASAPGTGEAAAMAALRRVLPFFEEHLAARANAEVVPHTGRVAARAARTARRVLVALPASAGLGGYEGAGLLAQGLADIAMDLAPRKARAETQP